MAEDFVKNRVSLLPHYEDALWTGEVNDKVSKWVSESHAGATGKLLVAVVEIDPTVTTYLNQNSPSSL